MPRKTHMATYYPSGEFLGAFPMKSKSAKRYESEWRARELGMPLHHQITKFVPVTEEAADKMGWQAFRKSERGRSINKR